jgi:catechol 2,3-dioxygenase-like lactoylglutathione lyase family enzyme
MFDHVKFGVSDYEKSKTFFLHALKPLGVELIDEGTPTTVSK